MSAIVTSPPYNLGVSYRSYDDSLPRASYLEWTDAWIKAAARTLTPHGSLFLNVGAKPTDPWTAMEVAQTARQHLHLQNTIHWIKSIAIDREAAGAAAGLDRDLAVGHYKPINSDRFVNDCHEFVFQFTPEGRTPLDRRADRRRLSGRVEHRPLADRRQQQALPRQHVVHPYETIQSRDKDRPHPATFPPRLAAYCLRLHGLSRLRLVMDPFLGLGSAAVACAELGVNFVGIELDEHYLGEAIERVRRVMVNAEAAADEAEARRRRVSNWRPSSRRETTKLAFPLRTRQVTCRPPEAPSQTSTPSPSPNTVRSRITVVQRIDMLLPYRVSGTLGPVNHNNRRRHQWIRVGPERRGCHQHNLWNGDKRRA